MDEVSEEEMLEAMKLAHDEIKKHCKIQMELAEEVGSTEKREYCHEDNDEDLRKKVWDEKDRVECQMYASQWTSLPHMQDWLAVRELKSSKYLEPGCVIVPGHRGILCGLGLLPHDTLQKKGLIADDFVNAIWRGHFYLSPAKKIDNIKDIKKEIAEIIPDSVFNKELFIKLFEYWQWQERQSKFIINSVRTYEFEGLDWWLPLWDMDFIRSFLYDCINLAEGRRSYDKLVKKIYSDTTGAIEDYGVGNANDTFINNVRRNLKKNMAGNVFTKRIYDLLRKIRQFLRRKRLKISIPTHMGFEGRYPEKEYKKLRREGYSINGVHSYYFFSFLKNYIENKNDSSS